MLKLHSSDATAPILSLLQSCITIVWHGKWRYPHSWLGFSIWSSTICCCKGISIGPFSPADVYSFTPCCATILTARAPVSSICVLRDVSTLMSCRMMCMNASVCVPYVLRLSDMCTKPISFGMLK